MKQEINRLGSFLPLLLALTPALFGCSSKSDLKTGTDTSKLERAFQSTDANTRTRVDKVVSAIQVNDFAGAILALKPLTTDSSLTSEQKTAAKNLMYEVQATFAEAADKGDTNALRAIEELRKAQGR